MCSHNSYKKFLSQVGPSVKTSQKHQWCLLPLQNSHQKTESAAHIVSLATSEVAIRDASWSDTEGNVLPPGSVMTYPGEVKHNLGGEWGEHEVKGTERPQPRSLV